VFVAQGGPTFTEADARAAIAASRSYAEALRRLGLCPTGNNWRTLKRYALEVWRIPVEHFDPHAAQREALERYRAGTRTPLSEILVADSTYHSRGSLKARLFAAGLKQRQCEMCGQGELWRGRRMSLILDHVNGVRNDNRLENLRIVCPNCAATLDTHCGRNLALVRPCETCGTTFKAGHPRQRWCSPRCAQLGDAGRRGHLKLRRAERPPYEQLMAQIREVGWSAVGRRYGVSDSAIRKWVQAYHAERAAAERDSVADAA
jgi:hypothetical protein